MSDVRSDVILLSDDNSSFCSWIRNSSSTWSTFLVIFCGDWLMRRGSMTERTTIWQKCLFEWSASSSSLRVESLENFTCQSSQCLTSQCMIVAVLTLALPSLTSLCIQLQDTTANTAAESTLAFSRHRSRGCFARFNLLTTASRHFVP